MPMNPKLLRPRQTIHPETADWASRVRTNGGSVGGTTLIAVDRFVKAIYSAGIRDRFYRLNLFCGTSDANLNAVRTPLFRGPSLAGTQFGNATDTNSNFVQGDYAEGTGLIGNGTTKALDTGVPANFANGRHLAFVPYTLGTTSFRYYMGVRNGGTPANGYLWAPYVSSPTSNVGQYTYDDAASVGGADGGAVTVRRLVFGNNVTGASGSALFSNGSQLGTPGIGFNTTATTSIGVFAVRQAAGTYASFVNARLSAYSIGLSMTAAQVVSYNSAMTAFLTAMGRA